MGNTYSRYLNEHVETMPRDQLKKLQERRLMPTLDYAYERSPLIESIWKKAGVKPSDINSMDDFIEKAPCFDKDDIRAFRDTHNSPTGGLARSSDLDINKISTTSGTTGDPTPMPIRMVASIDEGYARDFWEMGSRPGDYSVASSFTFRVGIGCLPVTETGAIPIPFRHDPHQIPRIAHAIQTYKPTTLTLLSTPMLLGFEQWFKETGTDPKKLFASIKGAIYGGEALSPRLKAMADSWGLELFETTSFGDVMSGTQCRAHDGFHAYEDMAIAECLDPNSNEPVADGEIGELVVTTLANTEIPFIRFRTDDLVIMNRETCSCGRTHARYNIRGRKGDQIKVKGKTILPLDIRFAIEAELETQSGLFQIIKASAEMDVLKLRVGHIPDRITTSAEELTSRLEEIVRKEVDVPVQIELTPDSELLKLGPPHKIPRVTKA